jgi:hypothetical protein
LAAAIDIEVVRERISDQLVEHRVAILLPPLGIGGVGDDLGLVEKGRRHIDLRPHVIRPHRARTEEGAKCRDDRRLRGVRTQ